MENNTRKNENMLLWNIANGTSAFLTYRQSLKYERVPEELIRSAVSDIIMSRTKNYCLNEISMNAIMPSIKKYKFENIRADVVVLNRNDKVKYIFEIKTNSKSLKKTNKYKTKNGLRKNEILKDILKLKIYKGLKEAKTYLVVCSTYREFSKICFKSLKEILPFIEINNRINKKNRYKNISIKNITKLYDEYLKYFRDKEIKNIRIRLITKCLSGGNSERAHITTYIYEIS